MASDGKIYLPYLLSALALAKYTGTLALLDGDVERVVYLHGGIPVHVRSSLQSETLGQLLLAEGRLKPDQYHQMLDTMVQTQRPAGEVLVALGYLGPQDVFSALEFQTRKKLSNCFKMADFGFSLEAKPVPPQLIIARPNTAEVVLSGIQCCYSVDRLLGEFPVDEETIFAARAAPGDKQPAIGPKESKVLRSLDEGCPLARLMAQGHELQSLLATLYALHALFLVEASNIPRPDLTDLELPDLPAEVLQTTPARPAPSAAPVGAIEPAASTGIDHDFEERPKTVTMILDGQIDARLAERVLSMEREDHFSLLGVSREARPLELETAYYRMLRNYRLQGIEAAYASDKERELAQRLLDRLTIAFRELSSPEGRAAYLQALKHKRLDKHEVSPRILADVEAQKGLLALAEKHYDEAETHFKAALRLYAGEPSYHCHLGRVRYLRSADDSGSDQAVIDELRKPFLRALSIDPRYDQARLYLGYIAKRAGDLPRALEEFQGALECNPQNKVALSEVRMLKRRIEDKTPKT